jgi:RNA polymerase sigma factor (sigma-70 family)
VPAAGTARKRGSKTSSHALLLTADFTDGHAPDYQVTPDQPENTKAEPVPAGSARSVADAGLTPESRGYTMPRIISNFGRAISFSAGANGKTPPMTSDVELLRAYARDRSETAFAELVRRHLDLVYSVALRNLAGDVHLAEDVTQQVFADLARKAAPLSRRAVLGGWLYRSAQFAAAKTVRGEHRRRHREQEAEIMQATPRVPEPDWESLRPKLDELVSGLNERDRDAIWLRFVANQSFGEIGLRLGLNENAARMRVERALAKLHRRLSRAGITSSLAALGTALAGQARTIAPATLAATVVEGVAVGVPALGSALFGGSLAASLALFFAGGLLMGGAASLALPEDAITGTEPTMTAKVLWSSGITPVVTKLRALSQPGPAAPNPPGQLPEIESILREVGLHAANLDSGPAPSWLYVGAPKAYLLKSKDYIELSITAFEGQVDEACAPLFVQLRLAPETISNLRRAMAEMLQARVEIAALAETRDPKPTRVELVRMLDTSDDEYRQRIHALLGDDRFGRFEAYFDSQPTRQNMAGIFADIALRTSPLTPEQRDAMVAAFHAEVTGQSPMPLPADLLSPDQTVLFENWARDFLPMQQNSRATELKLQQAQNLPPTRRPIYQSTGGFTTP